MPGQDSRWAIKVCPDCGSQVFGGGLCRQHDPPGHPIETMVARVSDLVVLRQRLAGAVDTLKEIIAYYERGDLDMETAAGLMYTEAREALTGLGDQSS